MTGSRPIAIWLMLATLPTAASAEDFRQEELAHKQRCQQENHLDSCNKFGWFLHHNGHQQEARTYFRQACEGQLAKSCNNLGVFTLARGDFAAAKNLLRKACQYGHPQACQRLSKLWHEDGNETLAAAYSAMSAGSSQPIKKDSAPKPKLTSRSQKVLAATSADCDEGTALDCIAVAKGFEQNGEFADAIALYEKACGKAEPFGCLSAAEIYSKIENFEYARRHVQRACRYVSEADCQNFQKNACHGGYGWDCDSTATSH